MGASRENEMARAEKKKKKIKKCRPEQNEKIP